MIREIENWSGRPVDGCDRKKRRTINECVWCTPRAQSRGPERRAELARRPRAPPTGSQIGRSAVPAHRHRRRSHRARTSLPPAAAVLINYYSTELDFNALLLWCSFVTVNRGLRVSPRRRATPRKKNNIVL